jgi:hypothetical protein
MLGLGSADQLLGLRGVGLLCGMLCLLEDTFTFELDGPLVTGGGDACVVRGDGLVGTEKLRVRPGDFVL